MGNSEGDGGSVKVLGVANRPVRFVLGDCGRPLRWSEPRRWVDRRLVDCRWRLWRWSPPSCSSRSNCPTPPDAVRTESRHHLVFIRHCNRPHIPKHWTLTNLRLAHFKSISSPSPSTSLSKFEIKLPVTVTSLTYIWRLSPHWLLFKPRSKLEFKRQFASIFF